jgi:nucleotide-binding universal stress UspA family protein
MLGSVALKVARQSPVPVLILRPEAAGATTLHPAPPRSIHTLVPLDGSLMAEEALAPAIALTRALSAPEPGVLHLASVLPFYQMEEQVQLVQAVQEYLASIERHIREREKDLMLTSSLLLHIDVASALLELAETGKGMERMAGDTGCDVIAMATHGRGSVQTWMLGSITERMLTATKLPLLMVRPQ